MASLTIRRLDDAIRDEIRLRAARNGRSVEDEVRVILREASQGGTAAATGLPQDQPASQNAISAPNPREIVRQHGGSPPKVTLIIGGGIAAYKSLDLIRRIKERGIH